jgi:S1-C subfamily serine protease
MALAAATLLAGGTSATASESPSPSPSTASSPSSATPLEKVSAYVQPSIVYIETTWTGYVWDKYNKMYLKNGKPFQLSYQCTGFVVNPDGYIATAGHCVDADEVKPDFIAAAAQWAIDNAYYQTSTLTVDDVVGFGDYQVEDEEGKKKPDLKVTAAWSQSAGGVETGKALPARVVKSSSFEDGDGALLKVEASNLNAIPLMDADPEIGTEVITVGYPATVNNLADSDFTPSYKEGSISSTKTMSQGLTKVYEVSAATSPGMSGGPAVNIDGEVVGVISFQPAAENQQFNFIQPVDITREMLGDAGTDNTLSDDSQAYFDGLDAYFASDKTTAVEKLQTVVDDQPTNELAKKYLEKAKDLPDPVKEDSSSDDSGSNMGLIIGIAVALLVLAAIVGGLLLMLSRNKKNKGSSTPPSGPAYAGPPAGGPTYQQQPGGGMATGATSTAVLSPPQPSQAQSSPSGPSAPSAPSPSAAPSTPPPAPVAPAPTAPVAESAPTVEEDVFCSNCGTRGEPGQKFCKHCGTPL